MFVRLAAILIAAVLLTVIGWRLYLAFVLPEIHARRVRRMERENEDLDRIIRNRRGR